MFLKLIDIEFQIDQYFVVIFEQNVEIDKKRFNRTTVFAFEM